MGGLCRIQVRQNALWPAFSQRASCCSNNARSPLWAKFIVEVQRDTTYHVSQAQITTAVARTTRTILGRTPSHVDLATLIHMTMTFEGDQFTWTFSPPLDRLTRISGEYELLTDTRMLFVFERPVEGELVFEYSLDASTLLFTLADSDESQAIDWRTYPVLPRARAISSGESTLRGREEAAWVRSNRRSDGRVWASRTGRASRRWIPRRMRRNAARHVPRKRRSAGNPVTTATATRGTVRRFWRPESGSIGRRLKPSRRNSGSTPTSRRQGRSFFRDEKCRHWKSGVAWAWQINRIPSVGRHSISEAPAASRRYG